MRAISNYSDFGWIANFGVVPLLRFSAFLFLPDFFNLFDRLFSVTLVLETIIHPFKFYSLYVKKHQFLPSCMRSVKILILLALQCTIVLYSISYAEANLLTEENIIISRGEHREFNFDQLNKFTIGNKEIITHKFNSQKRQLLIKGNQLGFTELVVWKTAKEKLIFRIYVLSKKRHLKILHLAQTIRSLGLKTTLAGPLIIVEGTLTDFNNYLLIKKLEKENQSHLHLKGHLSFELKNYIIGELYKLLFEEFIDHVSCSSKFFDVLCQYPISNPPSKELMTFLQKRYSVQFVPIKNINARENYKVKLKIIQLEKLNGEEISLGLDQLSGSLDELFKSGITSLIEQNKILLNSKEISMSTLAEPEVILRPEFSTRIEVGAEIPYSQLSSSQTNERISTSWKFAGLKVELLLKPVGSKLQINYQTNLTRPSDNSSAISGNKESSSVIVGLGKPLQIFQIGIKTYDQLNSALPLISRIPILGEIFKSKGKQETYKKISGVIILEKHGP